MERVLLGFSGGIDSFAAVEILRQQGYQVVALTLDTIGDHNMIEKACKRAEELGVEHIVADVSGEFERSVIDYFANEYIKGRTPAPCTICNNIIKWSALADYAKRCDCKYIATGHYFRIEQRGGRYYIVHAADLAKDQSYYLWGLSQEILAMAKTPMAEAIKSDIVSQLPAKQRIRESMGVCFLGGRAYGDLLRERFADKICCGDIVDKSGMKVGTHEGYPFYTIGQKRGLNTSVAGCVIAIDPTNNRLVLGTNDDLYHRNLIVGDYNIVNIEELLGADDVTVMIRGFGHNPQNPVKVEQKNEKLFVTLDDPAWALSVGQPVVFYRKNTLIGGGILENYF